MATAVQPIEFGDLMPEVVSRLCGDHNKAMSKGSRLRFGNHGSLEIDTLEGWFSDHESKAKGGVLELIQHKRSCNKHEALCWLEDQGLKERQVKAVPAVPTFYDYANEDAEVVYRVERRGKDKSPPFLQHGPDGNGGFHSARGCMQGVERVPYLLPFMLAADPSQIVFIVEGEKDAERLASEGLIATTNSGGAGKFGHELVKWFEGRRVVILPDNDQAGRDHAADVAAKLANVADSVAIVKLPELREKGDVSDYLAQGGSAFDLVNLFAEPALAEVDHAKYCADLDAEHALVDGRSAAETEDEAAALGEWITVASNAGIEPPPINWVVDEMLPAGAVTTMFGDGGVGKTLSAMQIGLAVSKGEPIFGFETTQSPVIGLFCEDTGDELHRRFHSICLLQNIEEASADEFRYQSRFGHESLLGSFDDKRRFIMSPFLTGIRKRALALGSKLIILDNIMHLYPGDQNNNGEITRFLSALNRLALDIDGSVLLLGHISRSQGSQYSGGAAWSNASRSRLFFGRPGDLDTVKGSDDEGVAPVNPDARILARLKANYAPISDPMALQWHHGGFIRPEDMPPVTFNNIVTSGRDAAEDDIFLACLRARISEKRAVSEKFSVTYAPTIFARMKESRGIGKKALERALNRLWTAKRIERGELPWRADRKAVEGVRETLISSREGSPAYSAETPENRVDWGAGDCAGDTVRETRETLKNVNDFARETAGGTPPIYKYISDTAPRGAVPDLRKANAEAEDRRFLKCLDVATGARHNVSHRPSADYAPTVFSKMPEALGMPKAAFESAMHRLRAAGEIEFDVAVILDRKPPFKAKNGIARKRRSDPVELTQAIEVPVSAQPSAVDQTTLGPPPEDERDPFNPEHWPEDDDA